MALMAADSGCVRYWSAVGKGALDSAIPVPHKVLCEGLSAEKLRHLIILCFVCQ